MIQNIDFDSGFVKDFKYLVQGALMPGSALRNVYLKLKKVIILLNVKATLEILPIFGH